MMENMVLSYVGPWAIIGDFNNIQSRDENKGGALIMESSVSCLREFCMQHRSY